jgi:hypothetical protein
VAPGYRSLQLAVFNAEPISILIDIAENTDFHGIVLCGVLEHGLLPEVWTPTATGERPDPLLRYYRAEWGPQGRLNRFVNNLLEENFVMVDKRFAPHITLPDILRGDWPTQWIWTRTDRTQIVAYENIDLASYGRNHLHILVETLDARLKYPGYANWPSIDALQALDRYVAKIQDRGGRVVFIRPVTTGEYGQYLDQRFPRAKFWDEFARHTSGLAIHFEEIQELASMTCADGSHLYHRDCKRFTHAVAAELRRRGVLPGVGPDLRRMSETIAEIGR